MRTRAIPIVLFTGLMACAPEGYDGTTYGAAAVPADQPMSAAALVEVETLLGRLGYFGERADGVITDTTRNAVRRYQAAVGLPATGLLSQALLDSLRRNAAAAAAAAPPPPVQAAPSPTQTSGGVSTGGSGGGRDRGGGGGGGGSVWN